MDTIIVENVPLGFSAGDYLATGSGTNLYTGSILTEGTDITGIIGIRDIEMTMRGRAIRGYGIDAVKNTQILNLEMTRLDDIMNIKLGFSDDKTVAQGLCRLWGWMDRVESLIEKSQLNFENCGVLAILSDSRASNKDGSEEVMIDGKRMHVCAYQYRVFLFNDSYRFHILCVWNESYILNISIQGFEPFSTDHVAER